MSEREWLPDPSGRYPYRARTNGVWGDHVSFEPPGADETTDPEGGVHLRTDDPGPDGSGEGQSPGSWNWLIGTLVVVAIIGAAVAFAATDRDSGDPSAGETAEALMEAAGIESNGLDRERAGRGMDPAGDDQVAMRAGLESTWAELSYSEQAEICDTVDLFGMANAAALLRAQAQSIEQNTAEQFLVANC